MAPPRSDSLTSEASTNPTSTRSELSSRALGYPLTSIDNRSHTLPSVFPPLSQANTSSVSLASSAAQGRPIPLSDTTVADRTTALRELSRSQPIGRHRYARVNGPPSTTATTTGTYSQPVLVRTYSGPTSSSTRARPASRRAAPSVVSNRLDSSSSRSRGRHGFAVTLVRPHGHKRPSSGDDMKLPPLEAFTFKSIMAEIGQDVCTDLDRIAEICARSRYSLSNQYEIHVAPHGSGAGFLQDVPTLTATTSPTLQAISSDDEHASTWPRRRRGAVRRRSTAYGTLETIMSSSRSSDEDKSKRKSAAEIAAEVRGRVVQPSQDESGSAHSTEAQASSELYDEHKKKSSGARSTLAAAILDRSRAQTNNNHDPLRVPSTALVSRPAIPETSHSHLMSTTTPEGPALGGINTGPPVQEQASSVFLSKSVAAGAIAIPEGPKDQSSLLGGLRFSTPWKGPAMTVSSSTEQKPGRNKSYAEGTLRQLLRSTESSRSREGKSPAGQIN
ncbi:hypothetical protein F5Y19DRAFT_53046 [Xylariaceae sp. FL1651]|nr:hypothetical protein F5Y19DRAFT_53046 [Xylariaceae sp. FL1651]